MTRVTTFILALFLATAGQLSAQQRAQGFKDPGTATILSVVIPGGGQFYSGETGKGAMILGVGMGGLIVGSALTASSNDASATPFLLGTVAYLGAWVYGIADASESARRMNTKNGVAARIPASVSPVVAPSPAGAGTQVGLSLRF
jgi:hypothetical protein